MTTAVKQAPDQATVKGAGYEPRAILARVPVAASPNTNKTRRRDPGFNAIIAAMNETAQLGQPVTIRTQISPITAEWLLGLNADNRRLSETKVLQYSDDMTGGRWEENGDGISVATCGSLNNGQHRLVAVIHSGMTITTNVTVGLTRKSRATNDIGLPRTLANVLTMDGVDNASIVGAMTRLIIGWETSGSAAIRPARENSGPKIQERIEGDAAIVESAAYTKTVKGKARGILSVSQIGFLHYILKKHSPEHAEEFLTGVTTGVEGTKGLDADDPRYIARERLAKDVKKLSNQERVEIVFRAWNMWRTGKTVARFMLTNRIPPLVK